MRFINPLAAAAAQARYLISKLELGADPRAREDARLAETRRLDADEVGRRADARSPERKSASKAEDR